MTVQASSRRATTPDSSDSLEVAIAALGQRGRSVELMPVLAHYWRELQHRAPEQRRRLLDTIGTRLRSGELTSRALVPIVLGDAEEDVVAAAVLEYLGTHPVSIEVRQAAIDDSIDWIRRGLALNRAAIFATLLGIADPAINDALGGLRLTLTPSEIAVICRRATVAQSGLTREFLGDWLLLLDACEEPDPVARALVAAAFAV